MRQTVRPWWRPELGEEEIRLASDVIRSDYVNDGDVTRRFEREVAQTLESPYAVAVTSGTTAIFLGLFAAGVGPGDEVIVPDMTFIATANAVRLAGATPILADIDADTLTLSPAAVTKAITSRTKAIVPVHVSGRAGTLAAIEEIAKQKGIPIVEDAAESLCSRFRGRFLGTHGLAGALSFSPNKLVTTGQGGIVLTASRELHDRLRELKDQGRAVQGTGGDDTHDALGFNFKLTNVQAAIGLAQLERLPARLKRQAKTYALYREGLAGIKQIKTFTVDAPGGEIPLWVDALAEDRDQLCNALERAGYDSRKFWHPLHTQVPYRDAADKYPVSSALAPKAVWLPSAFQLEDSDVQAVIDCIRQFYQSR